VELRKEQETELRNEIIALVEIKKQKEIKEQKNDQWEQALTSLTEMKDQLKNSDSGLLDKVENRKGEKILKNEQLFVFDISKLLHQEGNDTKEALASNNESNNENEINTLNKERSKAHPVPKDAYFKIQVGAYTNKISFDKLPHFEDIRREFSTTIKLNTYTSGLFHNFEEAKEYLQAVKNKGITDAFIVAFMDGTRIPIWNGNRPSKRLTKDVLATK